jgi:protein-disulfide isomerase
MGKRSHQKKVREAKRLRAEARRPGAAARAAPYVVVGGLAIAAFAALVFLSVGGSDGDARASHPEGYVPPTLGDPSTPVELVMWEDFQCPFCRRFSLSTAPELRARYVETGKLKMVWRNFQRYGQESTDAGVAAYCAGEQGKFWEYHDGLFEQQRGIQAGSFTASSLRQLAEDAGLDLSQFDTCVTTSGDKYRRIMAADLNEGRDAGVTGTPAFFINGTLVVGAQPTETFASYIENELRQAGQ